MRTAAQGTDQAPAAGPLPPTTGEQAPLERWPGGRAPADVAGAGRRRRARTAAQAALAVVAAAAVALAVGASTGSDTLEGPPSGSAGAGSGAGRVTESTAGPVQDGRELGFVQGFVDGEGGTTVVVDRALLLTGDEADAASAARGWESPVPNDVLVVDDDPTLREYPVDPDALVSLSVGLAPAEATDVPVDSSVAELRRLLPPSSGEPVTGHLFDLRVQDGTVVELTHVYFP